MQQARLSTIIVEQYARKILKFTDQASVLDWGTLVLSCTSQDVLDDPSILDKHRASPAQRLIYLGAG